MRDFALEVHFSKWEFKAKYNLAASDAQALTLGELLAMGSDEDRQAFSRLGLGYTETFGAPALRDEIARTCDTVRPEHVLCLAGAEEAGVLLLPASVFRSELNEVPSDFCRVGFGRTYLPEGLAALGEWLGRNRLQ